jgi:hypothetical protein
MDASQYLRRLKESCTQTISRPKSIDAGLRTQIVRNAAIRTYVPPTMSKSQTGIIPTNECCLKPQPGYDGAVTPIMPPVAGCISEIACNDLENRYADPIVLPGCPIPYMSSTYIQANSYVYQGTREQTSEAVRLRNCKEIVRPIESPTDGCLMFRKGILRTPVVNGFSVGTGAFTVEWYQKLVPIVDFSSSDAYYYTLFSIGDLNNETESMTFYYQVSPPNPIVYSAYLSTNGTPFYFGNFGTSGPNDFLPYTDITNQWLHIALVGDGAIPTNTLTMYVNGNQFGPPAPLQNYDFTISGQPYLTIGGQSPLNNQYYYNGCLTNFRFTKGEALYTGSFIPPTAPLSVLSSTQLLLKTISDFPIDDASTPKKPITPIGSIQFLPDSPFNV